MREFWSTVVGGRETTEERPAYRSILDLGTEQIKALVLESKEDHGFVVGAGSDRWQPPGWPGDPGVDVERMARSCDLALRQAEDMAAGICNAHVVPDWGVLGLPNCLTMAEVFAVTHHRPSSAERIGDRELRTVVERAQRLALQQLGRKAESLQSSVGSKIELLEAALADIVVDGHSVTNPLGFRGQDLTVAVFNVIASSSYLRAVEALATDLGLEILATVSGWQPLASMLGKKDGICIDVGGKATDIVLIRNGKAWTTASLPFGGSDFTRCLAEVLEISWEDAESLKLAYGRGGIGEPLETRLGETTRRVMEVWLGGVEATLNALSGSHPLPHRLNLCGGGSNLPGFVDAVRSYPWMQRLNFVRQPQVRLMQPREVSRVLDRTGQLKGQQDIAPLALADYSIAADVELDAVDSLLWRVKRPAIFESTGGRA